MVCPDLTAPFLKGRAGAFDLATPCGVLGRRGSHSPDQETEAGGEVACPTLGSELSTLPLHHRPLWEWVRLRAGDQEGAWVCVWTSLDCAPLRNKDFQEVTLEREGQVLLHFAMAYGFRNIQNLVQKLKRGRCPYHYVEVMACPAGSSAGPLLTQKWGALSGTRAAGSVPPGQEGQMWAPAPPPPGQSRG